MGKLSFDDRNGFFKQMLTKLPPERAVLSDPAHCIAQLNHENNTIRSVQCMGKLSFDDRNGFQANP